MDLADRVAVVTGGASGIGAATLRLLAARGARAVAWDVAPSTEVVTRTPMLDPAERAGLTSGIAARTALGRLGEAEDVAAAIVALLTLDWVTGQVVLADGGLTLHSPIDFAPAPRRRGD